MLSIPFYLYISFLFSCIYAGIAKIQGLSSAYPWTLALSDALFIPFAFTDLPRSFALRGVGGLHAIAISLLGYNLFTRNLSVRFNKLATAATEMRSPFADGLLRAKIKTIELAATSSPQGVSAVRSTSASAGAYLEFVCDGAETKSFEFEEVAATVRIRDTHQYIRVDTTITNKSRYPLYVSPASFALYVFSLKSWCWAQKGKWLLWSTLLSSRRNIRDLQRLATLFW